MQKIRYNNPLGNNIRNFRLANKLTQPQVIAQLQVQGSSLSRETYAKIESGIANISARDLVLLSKIFKTDISNFFAGIE